MVYLDSNTIFVVTIAVALIMGICFYSFAYIMPERSVATRFALGCALYAAAVFARFLAINPNPPLAAFVLTGLAWGVFAIAFAVQLSALRRLLRAPSLDKFLIPGIALNSVALLVIGWTSGDTARMGLPAAVTCLTLYGLNFYSYLKARGKSLQILRSMMCTIFVGFALLTCTQLFLRWYQPSQGIDQQALAASHLGLSLFFLIMSLGYILTFVLTQQQLISRLANSDPLTATLNRRGLEFKMQRRLDDRHGVVHGCIVMLEVDHFQSIVEQSGRAIANAVLRDIGIALHGRLRKNDLISRVSGEQFCLVLPGIHINSAQAIAERIRLDMSEKKLASSGTQAQQITVSIGLGEFTANDTDIEPMMLRAELALQAAKVNGKNRCEVWSPRLELLVRAAIKRPESPIPKEKPRDLAHA